MVAPRDSKMCLLTLGALKAAEDSSSRRVTTGSAASASAVIAPSQVEERGGSSEDKTATKLQRPEGELAVGRSDCCTVSVASAATTPALLSTSSAFLEQVTTKVSSYAAACRTASSLGDWMTINNQYFGSSVLYTDEISTGLFFGYCAGYAFNRALRVGALLCGIGFISLQTLHHFGYIKVNWKRVEEDIKRPLDLNGDGKVDQEDVAALQRRLLKFMAQGMPSTAGLSLGLLWGLRAGR